HVEHARAREAADDGHGRRGERRRREEDVAKAVPFPEGASASGHREPSQLQAEEPDGPDREPEDGHGGGRKRQAPGQAGEARGAGWEREEGGRRGARRPSGRRRSTAMTMLTVVSSSVAGNRLQISPVTGARERRDRPRSPWSARERNDQYWT